jgi:hypothetical protein
MADIESQLHVEKGNIVIKETGWRNSKGMHLETAVV